MEKVTIQSRQLCANIMQFLIKFVISIFQIQVVCDHTKKIRDVFVGYPGSVHDRKVFKNSPLCNHLEEKCGSYYLVGDSRYPLKKNLLSPFKDGGQLSRRQIYYNMKLSKTHYVIEHCLGILKQKFRQMFHVKLRNITYIVHLIRAACVLHNISINDDFISNDYIEMLDEVLPAQQGEDLEVEDGDRDAWRNRDNMVQNLKM